MRAALIAVVATSAFVACGRSAPVGAPTTSSAPGSSSVDAPSASTRMICAHEAQEDLEATLGVKTRVPPSPTWLMHSYSCEYAYADGSFALSVKQLSGTAETSSYFETLARTLTRRMALEGLGQGAFTTVNGSVVVQKDDKVLFVDVSRLPARFGTPPDSRANVAISIAATIMGCWTGA